MVWAKRVEGKGSLLQKIPSMSGEVLGHLKMEAPKRGELRETCPNGGFVYHPFLSLQVGGQPSPQTAKVHHPDLVDFFVVP